jgi:hypothetical protein
VKLVTIIFRILAMLRQRVNRRLEFKFATKGVSGSHVSASFEPKKAGSERISFTRRKIVC